MYRVVSESGRTLLSPLDAAHHALGAKMAAFGGWEMPISYPAGTLHEHRTCRGASVAFDVSHLGTVRVSGSGAYNALQAAFTNDLGKVGPGRAQYTHLLDADDGSVLDDIIVWWREAELFDVMPNASNTDRVTSALRKFATGGGDVLDIVDVTNERAVIAVQGPLARTALASLVRDLPTVRRFGVAALDVAGVDCVVAGTGYTGEDGVEIAVPLDAAERVWNAVLAAGVEPAGLGARDTLRLEAGLPLHGHELGPGITPLQAGLGWVVSFDKGEFRGRSALVREREGGVARVLRGMRVEGRQPAREGSLVRNASGAEIGRVTSGNFSPTLGCAIALGFLTPAVAVGTAVSIDVRGRPLAAEVVALPFVPRG